MHSGGTRNLESAVKGEFAAANFESPVGIPNELKLHMVWTLVNG
jgi:hypothetical protein